jgi:DNA end-binding protein Ku
MAARAIASATISFGLIAIPVKLYTSNVTASTIHFNQLHKDCGARLRQQLFCPKHDTVVERDEIVKGYEFAKGQYVLFTPEEVKALEEKSTQSIDIAEFVPAAKVDRTYLDRVYYLGPDKGGARPYRLLAAAMEKTKRAALGQYAARGKQYLVLIRPQGDGLVMEQLRYADEIRPFDEVPLEAGDVRDAELKLAIQLIEQTASDKFEPERYDDDVRRRTLEMIERKVDGEDITLESAEEPQTRIVDMMEALKASLAAAGTNVDERKPAKKAPAKKTAAKKTTTKKKAIAKRSAG